MSEIRPAIHLRVSRPVSSVALSLLHHLHIDLLHVHLLTEFGREFGRPKQFGIHSGRHSDWLLLHTKRSDLEALVLAGLVDGGLVMDFTEESSKR